jgi:hypothetical protein
MTLKDPEERYETAGDMLCDLDAIAQRIRADKVAAAPRRR